MFAKRIASKARWALALSVWPCAWIAVGVHHASICGVGFSAWTCDEPFLVAAVHQLATSLAPITALVLVAWASDREPRQ